MAFIVWWTNKNHHQTQHPSKVRAEKARTYSDEAKNMSLVGTGTDDKTVKPAKSLARRALVYKRVRVLATMLAFIPAGFIGFVVTSELSPSYHEGCDLSRLQADIIEHNTDVDQERRYEAAQIDLRNARDRNRSKSEFEIKKEIAEIEAQMNAAREEEDYVELARLSGKMDTLDLRPEPLHNSRHRSKNLRNYAAESEACLEKQHRIDETARTAVVSGVIVFATIPALVFILFLITPIVVRWVSAADHKD